MICDKCGGELKSRKALLGKKHVAGSSPDYMVHEENFSTLCPGTPMTPVLTQYYYISDAHWDAAKAGDEGAIQAAKERAEQERSRHGKKPKAQPRKRKRRVDKRER